MSTRDVHLCACGHVRRKHDVVCTISGCKCAHFDRKQLWDHIIAEPRHGNMIRPQRQGRDSRDQ